MKIATYLDDMRKQKREMKVGRIALLASAFAVALAPAILTSYGFGFSPILTGSMRPIANPGDIYITRLTTADHLHLGDVIAVNNQNTGVYYSHRISEIRPMNNILRITTKGDANSAIDRDPVMIAPQEKVSVVLTRIPWVGRPMVYMNTVQGRQAAASFLVVANILGLFAFLFRKKIYANFTGEKVYRELYAEERAASAQYREVIDQLQSALEIADTNSSTTRAIGAVHEYK